MTTAAREASFSVVDRSSKRIHSFDQGGIDYLAQNMKRLGLPPAITRLWIGTTPFVNEETGALVYPAEIPGMHQVLAYAAQLRLSFSDFLQWLRAQYVEDSARLERGLTEGAWRVWQSFAFLAPHGRRHTCGHAPDFKKHFLVETVVDYIRSLAQFRHAGLDLNDVLDDRHMHSYRIKSAKMRAVESIFFE